MFEKKVILTGVKPTGTPHLGNYLGAIKPAIKLGREALAAGGRHYMFIADYHAINAEKDPAVLSQKLKEIACIYLAGGLNPKESVFYRQSDIPEIHEITTILYAYTPKGFMNKAHAYKAAVDKNREANRPDDDGINMGLYTYPTLMATDILAFNTDIVPVGRDQVQHVEIARDIAGAINAHYGCRLLHLPTYYIDENVAVVPGIDGRKMSKSYGNVIPLFEDDKAIKKRFSPSKQTPVRWKSLKIRKKFWSTKFTNPSPRRLSCRKWATDCGRENSATDISRTCCWTPSLTKLKMRAKNTIITWHISARSRICCRTVPSKRGRRLRQR